MKCTIVILLTLFNAEALIAQDPNSIRSKCFEELSEINNKITDLNNEYEKIKSDLKNGLYCSKCDKSKTELDKSYPGGFYAHLGDVKGVAKPATQEQMQNAHQNYLSKFNSLKQQYDSKQKSCTDNYNNALIQKNNEAQQKQQDFLNQQRQQEAELQREFQQQQEVYRQKIIEESEKNKQDAIKMFNDNSNKIKSEISSIYMPSSTISFQNNNSLSTQNDARNKTVNVDDLGDGDLNNYLDVLSHRVEEYGIGQIVSESSLTESLHKGYEWAETFFAHAAASKDLLNGEVTENTVNAVFSHTENSVIQSIQNYSGSVAVRQANSIDGLTERIGNADVTEEDINSTIASMNPFHFPPTSVKEDKPWSMKDTAAVVGGGIILSTIGAPLWLGIGAAAWYGFKR